MVVDAPIAEADLYAWLFDADMNAERRRVVTRFVISCRDPDISVIMGNMLTLWDQGIPQPGFPAITNPRSGRKFGQGPS